MRNDSSAGGSGAPVGFGGPPVGCGGCGGLPVGRGGTGCQPVGRGLSGPSPLPSSRLQRLWFSNGPPVGHGGRGAGPPVPVGQGGETGAVPVGQGGKAGAEPEGRGGMGRPEPVGASPPWATGAAATCWSATAVASTLMRMRVILVMNVRCTARIGLCRYGRDSGLSCGWDGEAEEACRASDNRMDHGYLYNRGAPDTEGTYGLSTFRHTSSRNGDAIGGSRMILDWISWPWILILHCKLRTNLGAAVRQSHHCRLWVLVHSEVLAMSMLIASMGIDRAGSQVTF
jgi:hypothetical protein